MTRGILSNFGTFGNRSFEERMVMDLPIHLGMDSRARGVRPAVCCQGGMYTICLYSFLLTHTFWAYFYSKCSTGCSMGERNTVLRHSPGP